MHIKTQSKKKKDISEIFKFQEMKNSNLFDDCAQKNVKCCDQHEES